MRALLTRRWLVAHVVLLAAITTCLLAGKWQLRRLHDRREHNRLLLQRESAPPVDITEIAHGTARDLAYRRATVVGTFDGATQVIVPGRVLNGATGSEVLTPLRTSGIAVLVVRGWIPQQIYDPANPPPTPVSGSVVVTGILVPSDDRGRFESKIPSSGVLKTMPRIDVARVRRQAGYALAPVALRLRLLSLRDSNAPAPSLGQPVPAPLQPLGEGPHFSYAIQWFLFAAVFAIGYGVLVRRSLARPR